MVKKFLGNGLLLIAINLLVKPFWLFGIDRQVQNTLTDEYGLYFALFNFTFLFSMVLDMGVTNFNSRHIAQNPEDLKFNLSKIVGLKLMLFFAYLILTLGSGLVMGYEAKAFKLILLLCINMGLSYFLIYLRSNLAGLQLFKVDAWISGLDKTLVILLCIPMIYGNVELSMFRFIGAQITALAVSCLVVLSLLIKKSGGFKLNFNIDSTKTLLKKTFPYALLGILSSIYAKIDAVMLERMLYRGDLEAGIYAEGYRLLDAFTSVFALASAMLLAMFAKQLSEKLNYLNLRRTAAVLMIFGAIFVALICWNFPAEIVDYLYPGRGSYNQEVFRVVLISVVPLAGIYVYGTFLTSAGKLRLLNIVALIGLIINFTLNYVFIPEYGALGSAWVTLATQTVVASTYYVSCRIIYP